MSLPLALGGQRVAEGQLFVQKQRQIHLCGQMRRPIGQRRQCGIAGRQLLQPCFCGGKTEGVQPYCGGVHPTVLVKFTGLAIVAGVGQTASGRERLQPTQQGIGSPLQREEIDQPQIAGEEIGDKTAAQHRRRGVGSVLPHVGEIGRREMRPFTGRMEIGVQLGGKSVAGTSEGRGKLSSRCGFGQQKGGDDPQKPQHRQRSADGHHRSAEGQRKQAKHPRIPGTKVVEQLLCRQERAGQERSN